MRISGFSEAQGDLVGLKTVNELHIGDGMRMQGKGEKVVSSFAESFNNAIAEVNDLEIRSTELATQMAVDPESVDIHDVQIAAEEAEMAVLMTKSVVDRAIKAYKEITSLQ